MENKIFTFENNESLKPLAKWILDQNKEALLLNGELGAGKTTLTKEIAKQIGIKDNVVSPTFNTILVYDGLVHIDAYKLTGDLTAFEDYFEDNFVIIEWSDRIKHPFSSYIKINAYIKDQKHIFEVVEVK